MSQDDAPESSSASPFEFLKFAVTRVPALNWTIGVGGIVAVAAMIYFWNVPAPVAVLGSVALLIGMIGLSVVANLIHPPARQRRKREPAAILMLITSTLLIVGTAALSFTSLFFDWPIQLRSRYFQDSSADVPTKAESPILTPSIFAMVHSVFRGAQVDVEATSPVIQGAPSDGITDAMLEGLADWIESYYGVADAERASDTADDVEAAPITIPASEVRAITIPASEVRVKLAIPAEGIGEIILDRSPAGPPVQATLWWVDSSQKLRLALSNVSIQSAPDTYSVHLTVPGYDDQVVDVVKAKHFDQELVFSKPEYVDTEGHRTTSFTASNYRPRVVFRENVNDRGATARLAALVHLRGKLTVVDPEGQAEAERMIKEYEDQLIDNPSLQLGVLTHEVDSVVTVVVKDVLVP